MHYKFSKVRLIKRKSKVVLVTLQQHMSHDFQINYYTKVTWFYLTNANNRLKNYNFYMYMFWFLI